MRLRLFVRLAVPVGLAAALTQVAAGQQRVADSAQKVDAVFARWNEKTPGCAVGVSVRGEHVLEKAYGMADLEHDVKNGPETIFEAGSVSKQFTAAAVLLLAHEGKLSLDDPVRKYIPELPDYGAPLTIRHMLTHTSGLRDWGSVASIAGWPRTTRVHTHAHVLDIVSRQRALNFPSGTRYSYSNTGYNLAAVLVSRVSGQSFAEFSRTRIFEPLGLEHTSWRDDFTRVVKGRAIAYSDARDGFRLDMPFENVHGNGGLLTTVGDLLRWTANFSKSTIGSPTFAREMQEPGRFSDGRQHDYAFGLRVIDYKGAREVGHSGSTAGYRAYLANYPERGVAVGVLCNVSSGAAGDYAHAVADVYLGTSGVNRTTASAAAYALKPEEMDAVAGDYRDINTGEPLRVAKSESGLALGQAPMRAESGSRFTASSGRTIEIDARKRLTVTDQFGRADVYERISDADLKPRPFTDYVGTYSSDEAEVTYRAEVRDGGLVLLRRPDTVIRLSAVYADGFRAPLGVIWFRRNADGQVTGFTVSQDRVWSLAFARQREGSTSSQRLR
jgi:CubicO group peptidase (beta-lactamase class C family)